MTGRDDEDLAEEEDPFDQLAADVDDREGDPFESLSRDEPGGGVGTEDPGPPERDESRDENVSRTADETAPWGDEFEPEKSAVSTSGPGRDDGSAEASEDTQHDAEGTTTDPGEIDIGIGEQPQRETSPLADVGDREGDPFEEGNSLFEERDTEGIDPEVVWQDLASAGPRSESGDAYERTFADVSKHSYCEQCEYFSPPPDIACTHEGTDIVEFLDMETVRVVDCPIVAERRELESDE